MTMDDSSEESCANENSLSSADGSLHVPPNISKIVDWYNVNTTIVNSMWAVLLTLTLATLAFVCSGSGKSLAWIELLALTACYVYIAMSNRASLLRSQEILVALSDCIKNVGPVQASFHQCSLVIRRGRLNKWASLTHNLPQLQSLLCGCP